MLTYYLPRGKVTKVKNLLADKQEEQEELEPEQVRPDEMVSHWHHVSHCQPGEDSFMNFNQNLTLALVSDSDKMDIAKMTPPVAQRTYWCLHIGGG